MVNAFSFSYTPKPSTALAAITPLKLLGEGRESLRFTASTPMSFIKQNPEVVTEGFWKGRQALTEGAVKGVTSALSGVAGGLTSKAAETKADTDAKTAHERAVAIAKIKSEPTVSEQLYQAERRAIMQQQLSDLKGKADDRETESESDARPVGVTDFNSYNRSIEKKDFEAPVNELPSAPANDPAKPLLPTAPPAPNAPVFPKGVSRFAPNDPEGAKGLFAYDQNTPMDKFGNIPSRQVDMAFNLKPLAPSFDTPAPELVAAAAPAAPLVNETVFGKSDNPNFTPLREIIKNRGIATESQPSVAPSQELSYSTINLPPFAPEQQLEQPFELPIAEVSIPRNLQKSEGDLALTGATLPLMPVSGAEDKPLSGTPSPVEPPLPEAQPAADNYTDRETEAEYRFRVESDLTGQPFANPAEARMAKMVLERELGVKAKVNGVDAGKGKRIYRVEIVEDALSPMEGVPKDMVVKSVTQKDGTETRVLIPKMPVGQQIQSVDVALDRAKTLKTAIKEIRSIAGGISPGIGGLSNLMNKLPISTDASTVRALNNTIKGIIGFEELVALKAAGGTLGALSDEELKMLTSLQGSLDVDNLNSKTYLKMLQNIEDRTSAVQKKMEAYKKELMTVEKPTKFQSIQSEKPKNEKDKVYIINNSRYKWDGNEYKLIE
jgi:hypothetical protein